jgi:hypothetical protein
MLVCMLCSGVLLSLSSCDWALPVWGLYRGLFLVWKAEQTRPHGCTACVMVLASFLRSSDSPAPAVQVHDLDGWRLGVNSFGLVL